MLAGGGWMDGWMDEQMGVWRGRRAASSVVTNRHFIIMLLNFISSERKQVADRRLIISPSCIRFDYLVTPMINSIQLRTRVKNGIYNYDRILYSTAISMPFLDESFHSSINTLSNQRFLTWLVGLVTIKLRV